MKKRPKRLRIMMFGFLLMANAIFSYGEEQGAAGPSGSGEILDSPVGGEAAAPPETGGSMVQAIAGTPGESGTTSSQESNAATAGTPETEASQESNAAPAPATPTPSPVTAPPSNANASSGSTAAGAGPGGPGANASGGSSPSSSGGPGASMGPGGSSNTGNSTDTGTSTNANTNTQNISSYVDTGFIASSNGHRADLHIELRSGIANGSDVLLPSGYYFNNTETYTYEKMERDLNHLKESYPSMQMDSLGTTVDGRSLYHVIVGNPEASYKVLVHASIHAREYIVSQLVMREIASLLEMQQNGHSYDDNSLSTLLQDCCIHFIPMVNPDGVTIAQSGMQNIRSDAVKNLLLQMAAWDGREPNMDFFHNYKANANGTNLNRNFDANWDQADPSPGHPHIAAYKGTGVECEAETKALGDLTRKYMFDRTISYHTQGQAVYYNFEMSEACRSETMKLLQICVNNTGYEILDSYSLTNACGYKDWVQYKLDIPSVTIECGKGSHPLPEEQITGMWEENKGILPDLLSGIYRHA